MFKGLQSCAKCLGQMFLNENRLICLKGQLHFFAFFLKDPITIFRTLKQSYLFLTFKFNKLRQSLLN